MTSENSSNKIFIVIIALLLIGNIGTLVMLLGSKRSEADHNRMRNFLKTDVGFSEKQLQDFDSVKADYKAQAKMLLSKMQEDKQINLKQLSGADFSDSTLAVAATAAASDQQQVELNMLRHIRLIRNLCTPQQRDAFDTGFYKIMAKAADAKKKEK